MSDYGTMSSTSSGGGGNGAPPLDVQFSGSFSPTELFALAEAVGTNVAALGAAARLLEKSAGYLGTKRDTKQMREKAHEIQNNMSPVIATTTKDLQRLTILVRRGDKRQKLQVEKLMQSFTESVTKYSATQKQYAEKMRIHASKVAMTNYPPEEVDDDESATLLQREQQAQIAQNRKLEFENGLLEERESYIRDIETKVIDVNQILQELGTIVHSQGTVIDTIESNIETAGDHVEAGREELVKAARYQAKFRRKLFILILIALAVGIVLTIIIVSSVKR